MHTFVGCSTSLRTVRNRNNICMQWRICCLFRDSDLHILQTASFIIWKMHHFALMVYESLFDFPHPENGVCCCRCYCLCMRWVSVKHTNPSYFTSKVNSFICIKFTKMEYVKLDNLYSPLRVNLLNLKLHRLSPYLLQSFRRQTSGVRLQYDIMTVAFEMKSV